MQASDGKGCEKAFGKAKFVAEVLIMTVLLYYLDIVLDVMSIMQMWESGNPKPRA